MQDVYIVDEERLSFRKEWGCLAYGSSRVEQVVAFVADAYVDAELLVGVDKVDNLLGEMMHVHHDMTETAGF